MYVGFWEKYACSLLLSGSEGTRLVWVSMTASLRATLGRNFGLLLKRHGDAFRLSVVNDVLNMQPSGCFSHQPSLTETDILCLFHGPPSSSEVCSCLFPGVPQSRCISTVTIERFVAHMKEKTTRADDNACRVCSVCSRQVLPTSRVFIYDDTIFRALVVTQVLEPYALSMTHVDLPRLDDRLEASHLLFVYLFFGHTDAVIEEMSAHQVETIWTVFKVNPDLEKLRTLQLTGTSRWTGQNLKWPVLYAHTDDTRCTCMGTPIESCCERFDFKSDIIVDISKSQPWNQGLFFISLGRAIHHLAFHTNAIDESNLEERQCLLCHQRIVFRDFAVPDMALLSKIRAGLGRGDPMIVESNADSEAVVEDKPPKIIPQSNDSASLFKRPRPHHVHVSPEISEPVFKKAKTGLEEDRSVVRPKVSLMSKLPKVTPEIVEAIFQQAFEDDILRKNLDQWLPWIARSYCQPADRIPNRTWDGAGNMSTELITSDGFVRMNRATELSSVSIYIPRATQRELDAEYERVVNNNDAYSFSARRGTTHIFCRNVRVMFPYNFDFARLFIASSCPGAIPRVLDDFVGERTGGYRSLVIDAAMGATEIKIEPLVLSRFDRDVAGDDDDDGQQEPLSSHGALREKCVADENVALGDISHIIKIVPIQDNAKITDGNHITHLSADIVFVTPHPFKIRYPVPGTALFCRGELTANGSRVPRHTGYSIATVSLERLAADLGIVAPSVPRKDVAIPLNPRATIVDDYARDNEDHLRAHGNALQKPLGHLKNPLRFIPTSALTDMLFWPPGSGFVIQFDEKTIQQRFRKRLVGVGADGILPSQSNRVEIQPCPMYRDPKTGSVVVTYDGRWLLHFVPDEHAEGTPVVSYTVSTNRYLWDKDRTPVNTAADFVVAGGPRVSFFNADDELSELRSCIDPGRPVGRQLRNMERIGSNRSSAVVQTPQLKDHYSVVRIYTRSFLSMLDLNFVRLNGGVYSKESLETVNLDIYWRATVPRFQLFNEDNTPVPHDDLTPKEIDVMTASTLDQAGVRLIVRNPGFYRVKQILDAPVFMVAEQQLFSTAGRDLFSPDSPMLLPEFEEHGKVHLARNSIESTSRLDQFEKFQIDRKNMLQLVLASTIAKRVINHPSLPFAPIADHAAMRYTLVSHFSNNIHRHYPWVAGIFPWLTFDLSMPLDADVLRQKHADEEERERKRVAEMHEQALPASATKRSRSKVHRYKTCLFCKMLTIPITSKRKPARHSPQACPLFFEYSNSERALLEFALMNVTKLNPSFKDKLLYKPKEGELSVKGYRLNIELFKNLRTKLRVSFGSRLSSLIKCESSNFGPVFAEEIKLKYSTVCIPERLPWVTLLTSFCGDNMMDLILRDGATTGFPSSKDEIVPLEKEPVSSTPHVAPTEELRSIFFGLHQKIVERLRAEEAAAAHGPSSSSSLSSSSDGD